MFGTGRVMFASNFPVDGLVGDFDTIFSGFLAIASPIVLDVSENGRAIGVGFAYPVTIEQFRLWAEGLKAKGYQLAPASALVKK